MLQATTNRKNSMDLTIYWCKCSGKILLCLVQELPIAELLDADESDSCWFLACFCSLEDGMNIDTSENVVDLLT